MTCPFSFSRRTFLAGMTASAAVAVPAAAHAQSNFAGSSRGGNAAAEVFTPEPAVLDFHGAHQQGVITPIQKYSQHVALDLQFSGKDNLERFLRTLSQRARSLMAGGTIPPDSLALPAGDSGELGPVLPTDNLSITIGVGESLFDERFGLGAHKPAHLSTMQAFADDSLDPKKCHGDLIVQICAAESDTVLHALRDILHHVRGNATVRWRQNGFQNEPRPTGTPRNHLGFKDGIVNPTEQQYDSLVWAGAGEPAWAAGGSYMAVRLIAMYTEFWDRISKAEQEQIFGRDRETGGPLSGGDEFTAPTYLDDPTGEVIPTDAHIRLANPRTPETADQLILRRAYNYDNGIRDNGTLDVGLVFVCFQQDLDRQFITIQKRLEGEPLADYIRPYGGGYFFILPGAKDSSDYVGSGLINA